jgi:signal transduction histidine kinase
LFKYNKVNDDFVPVPGFDFQTQNILEDENGLLWVCTLGNGVYTLDQRTGKIENFRNDPQNANSLSNNMVNGQYMDGLKNLWFATEGGLCKYNPQTKIFKNYTIKNGFPSNFLFKILEDKRKNLWISTTKGLVCFNPLTEKIKIFTTANGLLNDQFNWNSAYKDSTGQMYFGSVKGMINFIPEKFTINNITPPVYITGIQVYNKEIPIGENHSPLKKSITYTNKITLPHNQSTLSIDFAALSYASPEMNEYSYKMEGLDKDWTLLKANRKVYFTELPPGLYTFKVKASNSSGVWNQKETSLQIEILPSFWKSKWAYLLYVVCGFALLSVLIHNYHKRVDERNKRKMELLDHQKEKELYQHKIDFFTNVAHEIRTPLTLIQGPMENIMNYVDDVPEIKSNLKIMERNTKRLLDISDQLLDFRRIEEKGFSLNFESINITEILQDLHTSFHFLALQHDVDYDLYLPVKNFYCDVDPDSVHKILSNLYSNAIKYSSKKVQVKFIPLDQENKFQIEISNDGFLIPSEMKEKIFEPFFRLKETSMLKGTGIGLAISRTLTELHKGTLQLKDSKNGMNVFVLELPVHHSKEVLLKQNETDIEKTIIN